MRHYIVSRKMTCLELRRTKKALALSALSLTVIYVLANIEQHYPNFHVIARAATANATRTGTRTVPNVESNAASAQVPWSPAWQRRGESFARSFWKASHNDSIRTSSHWWCTQSSNPENVKPTGPASVCQTSVLCSNSSSQ